MVNLVVVSHSAELAEGVAKLAAQMIRDGGCRLAVAAGVDDEEHPIGTDAVKIMTAIESVFDPSGVVVFMDLGSALLSAETALDLLDPDYAERVRLSAAPLVEGVLAAAVAASGGAALDDVLAEAAGALDAKREQLGEAPPAAEPLTPPPAKDARRADWRVENPQGLHARPAARLVSALSPFNARLTLEKAGRFANAVRLNHVAALQVRQGDKIVLHAEGEQAEAALAAFLEEARAGFGELLPTGDGTLLHGKPVAEGSVTAPARWLTDVPPDDVVITDPARERRRFAEAVVRAQRELAQLRREISNRLGTRFAGIFEAQSMLLDDEDLVAAVDEAITRRDGAANAWRRETDAMAALYAGLEDTYLRVRELDVRDLQARLLGILNNAPAPAPLPAGEYIVIGAELFPSRLASLDRRRIAGIALEGGHPLSHTAILARAMGIPIVVNMGGLAVKVRDGQSVTLDPVGGTLLIA
ncbi:dihydroxyacetone kinase phosphoryl donor subunit DhaM [Martelella alba]|uniref:phosphoenolpyruvate--glycerone phosphotransferase n=1 Tax=Martelella alba TaxID=2590451 RepID=A0ABY2SMS3_9HYPH|nr:dihydroxyacetone kinase phosphoryl donor subunit DhaM [Martelella alba]TKI07180.1 HPr family phosphocarrier protein [Martelella alba]